MILSLSVETLLLHRSHSRFFYAFSAARSSVIRVSRTRSISKRPRETFSMRISKVDWKVTNEAFDFCSESEGAFRIHGDLILSIRVDVTSCLACHTISRRKATIKALRLYRLFATCECLVRSQLMPLPLERDIYCGTACV